MNYNFNKPSLFFFFTIILFLPITAYGHDSLGKYFYSDVDRHNTKTECVWMHKYTNDDIICVFDTSVEKLIERNYAYLHGYWVGICDDMSYSEGLDCHITHHPQFLKRDGLPSSLYRHGGGCEETEPPTCYAGGHFYSKDDVKYDYTYGYREHLWFEFFSIDENKLE